VTVEGGTINYRIDADGDLSDQTQALAALGAEVEALSERVDQVEAVMQSYDLIVVLGQSNAKGQATDYNTTSIDVVDPQIYTFPGRGVNAGTIVQAQEPLEHVFVSATGMGICVPFARQYLASHYSSGKPVLIVPCAVGGTGFAANGSYAGRWQVDDVPGTTNMFETAVSQIQSALAVAGAGSRVVAILFHQEEADDNLSMSEATYAGYQDALISGLRSRIPSASRAPFVIGQSSAERRAVRGAAALGILAAKTNTPGRVELSGFGKAPPTGFTKPGDATHYNAQGIRLQAASMFFAFERATRNRRGTQPVKVTAVYLDGAALSWEPSIGRVTSYLAQYQAEIDGEWITAYPDYALSTTVSLPESAVAARVAAINEIGTSEYQYNSASVSAPVVGYPYDGVDLDALYGLSKLRADYVGPLARVRRDTDNSELDVYSTSEALSHCASGSGFVAVWYDQSGNGRNYVQADASRQPALVVAGALVLTASNAAAIKFDGSDDGMVGAFSGAYAAGAMSISMVCEGFTGSASGSPIFGEYSSSSTGPNYEIAASSGGGLTQYIRNDSNTVLLDTSAIEEPYPLTPGVTSQLTVVDDGANYRKRSRRQELTPLTYSRAGSMTVNQTTLGARFRNGTWSGHRAVAYAEIAIRYDEWSPAELSIVEGATQRLV